MPQRRLTYVLVILAINAVYETSSFLVTEYRDDLVETSNISANPNGETPEECDPLKIDRKTSFCISVTWAAFPAVPISVFLKVEFKSDKNNCWGFVVAGGARVDIFGFVKLQLELEYEVEQTQQSIRNEAVNVVCSEQVPTVGIIWSHIYERIANWAKWNVRKKVSRWNPVRLFLADGAEHGEAESSTQTQEWITNKIMEKRDKIVAKWKEHMTHITKGHTYITMDNLDKSLKAMHEQVRTIVQREWTTGEPFTITGAVGIVVNAFEEAHYFKKNADSTRATVADGNQINTCFDLPCVDENCGGVVALENTERWMWCYFTNMFPFSLPDYRLLLGECLDTTVNRDEWTALWEGVKNDQMGIVVHVHPDMCDEEPMSGDDGEKSPNCLISFPRAFLALYPCTASLILSILLNPEMPSSQHARLTRPEGMREIKNYIMQQFDIGAVGDITTPLDVNRAGAMSARRELTILFERVVGNEAAQSETYKLSPWMWLINAYVLHMKNIILGSSDDDLTDGFVGSVASLRKLKKEFSINFDLEHSTKWWGRDDGHSNLFGNNDDSTAGKGYCDRANMAFRASTTWSNVGWRPTKTCLAGSIPRLPFNAFLQQGSDLGPFGKEEVSFSAFPKLCYIHRDEETGARSEKGKKWQCELPVTFKRKIGSCAVQAFFSQMQEKQRICEVTDEAMQEGTLGSIHKLLTALVEVGGPIDRIIKEQKPTEPDQWEPDQWHADWSMAEMAEDDEDKKKETFKKIRTEFQELLIAIIGLLVRSYLLELGLGEDSTAQNFANTIIGAVSGAGQSLVNGISRHFDVAGASASCSQSVSVSLDLQNAYKLETNEKRTALTRVQAGFQEKLGFSLAIPNVETAQVKIHIQAVRSVKGAIKSEHLHSMSDR